MSGRAALLLYAPLAVATFACAGRAADGEQVIVLQDMQRPFTKGSYSAYASPWSTFFDKSLVHGRDYQDTIEIRPSSFPDGTVIDSRWPVWAPARGSIWGYHAVSFGNYDGGSPPVKVVPKQVKDITRFAQTFRYSYTGSMNFNLLTEFYLTANAGDPKAKIIEIGFILHSSPSSFRFFRNSEQLGDFTDATGRSWKIARAGTFVTLRPADYADLTDGSIDMKAVLDMLVQKGAIKGTEWFNGIAFGIEPAGGQTRLAIDHWQVDYQ